MYVKRRKISITASCIGGSVVECLHVGPAVRVRLPVPAIIFFRFFQVFSKVFCKLGLGLVLVFFTLLTFFTFLTLLTVRVHRIFTENSVSSPMFAVNIHGK